MSSQSPHHPVLYQEIIDALSPRSPGKYIDGTVGAGGHAWGILHASSPNGQLLGLDKDKAALKLATTRLAEFEHRVKLVHASYVELLEVMKQVGWHSVDGVLLDLGLSSMQLDQPARGFSFRADGPLDMRFDTDQPVDAAELVNTLPEKDLAEIIWTYGEDRNANRIARAILQNRPVSTTKQLADLIEAAVRGPRGRIHPATKTFQALRMAVNEELKAVETVLPRILEALTPGGMMAVISFHSLEDRLVKQFIKRESRDCICPPEQPICTCGHKAQLKAVDSHAIVPKDAETAENPRARSAKLRLAVKL